MYCRPLKHRQRAAIRARQRAAIRARRNRARRPRSAAPAFGGLVRFAVAANHRDVGASARGLAHDRGLSRTGNSTDSNQLHNRNRFHGSYRLVNQITTVLRSRMPHRRLHPPMPRLTGTAHQARCGARVHVSNGDEQPDAVGPAEASALPGRLQTVKSGCLWRARPSRPTTFGATRRPAHRPSRHGPHRATATHGAPRTPRRRTSSTAPQPPPGPAATRVR